jgi:Ger(x)C family germination protein
MGIGLDKKDDLLQVTYTIPNLPVLTGQGGGDEKNFVKVVEAETLHDANKKYNLISPDKLTFDHSKIIVMGNEFLQDDVAMRKMLDYLTRSPEYAMSLLIITTDKTAKELLEAKPNAEEPNSLFISELFSGMEAEEVNDYKTTLLDFLISVMDTKGGGSLPLIKYKDKEISLDGITIIKGFKECGTLSIEQMVPFNWIRGTDKGENTIRKETYILKNITYEISEVKRKVEFKKTKQGIDINILVSMEGDIIEFELAKDIEKEEDFFKEKSIKEMEKELKEGMEEEANSMVKYIQNELGVDILDLSESMKIQEGKLWEEMKDNWDLYFVSANIHVEIEPNIRRIGMTK